MTPTLTPLAILLALVVVMACMGAVDEDRFFRVIAGLRNAWWTARFNVSRVVWWAGVETQIWRIWTGDIARWWRRRPRWRTRRDTMLEEYDRRCDELMKERVLRG